MIAGCALFRVRGDSMLPTLRSNDYMLVSSASAGNQILERGSIVLTAHAEGTDVKRIVGLPNERITFSEGLLLIDGTRLIEPYLRGLPAVIGLDFDEYELGCDDYFVMGDNRAHSTDSRHYGPVNRKRIEGKALYRIWPPRGWGRL